MKLLIIILFLLCSHAYGQRLSRRLDDPLKKGDSLEVLYAKDSQFRRVVDTLPLYTLDENSGWREIKLVTYYYDSPNRLRKISFRNGKEGYYYFYFEGVLLKKVRGLKGGGIINLQYYFTTEDNQLTSSEIEQRIVARPQMKELYELLKMSRTFTHKFKTLL